MYKDDTIGRIEMSTPKIKNLLKLTCGLPIAALFAFLGHWDAAAALLAGLGYLAWEIIRTDERDLT